MDDKSLGVFAGFKAVRQPTDRVGLPLIVALPGNFSTSRPLLVAWIERCKRDDQPIVVVEVRHQLEL